MIKVEVLEDFTLKNFSELKNIERGSYKNEEGKLFKRDKFECSKEMCEYLTGKNPLNKEVVKVIEVKPEKDIREVEFEVKSEEVKELVKEKQKEVEEIIKPKKKKTSKK